MMLEKLISIILWSIGLVVFGLSAMIYIPLLLSLGAQRSTWFRRCYGQIMIKVTFNRYQVVGKPPPTIGPYLFVPNHQSMFDAFMLASAIPYHTSAVAKVEAFSIPLFGFMIRRLGVISINRRDHRNSMLGIGSGVEKIKAGIPVIIFPEGTRSKDGEVAVFKPGAFKLALESQAIIVPIGISGSYDCQPAKSWILRPGSLKINFGQPLSYEQYKNLTILELSDLVRQKVIELAQTD